MGPLGILLLFVLVFLGYILQKYYLNPGSDDENEIDDPELGRVRLRHGNL